MEQISKRGVIFFHPDLLTYDDLTATDEGGRLSCIIERLVQDGLWDEEKVCQLDIAPMKRLRDVHDEEYLNEIHRKLTAGVEKLDERTIVREKSFEIARLGAGGVLDGIDAVMTGEVKSAFCLTAMPGHHAGIRSFGGGCIINYAAVGAHYLIKKYQLKRVAIIDLDASHGNGTQEIFWKRKDVLFISIHEYPGFPGSGHYSEIGDNPAKGYTINIPLPSGYGDREYLAALKEIAVPILKQYKPEFLIISYGTNTLAGDKSYHLLLSEAGHIAVLQELLHSMKPILNDRIVSVLEEGTPGKLMARAVSNHIMLLLNNRVISVDKGKKMELVSYSDWYHYSKLLKNELKKYWKI